VTSDRGIVLVTGANGFVGRNLEPALADDGWTVRCAVRRLSSNNNEILIDSIGAQTDWSTAMTGGIGAVVHLAGRAHQSNDKKATDLYQAINADGTLHLARSAASSGVRQFVFVSTALVHGRTSDGRAPFRETDILMPQGPYAISKVSAEAGLKAIAQETNMSITVVRPPLVYGAGARGNFARLATAVQMGIPLPFSAIHNQRAFISVQNLSSFIASVLSKPAGKFESYLVADSEQISTPEFVRRLAAAAGKRPRLFPVSPSWLMTVLCWGGWREASSSLIGSFELDVSKALATGWQPKLSLDIGLQHALCNFERL